jgi:HK97 family phage major capsid protein
MAVTLDLKQVREERAQLLLDAEAINMVAKEANRDLSDDESAKIRELLELYDKMQSDEDLAAKYEAARAKAAARRVDDRLAGLDDDDHHDPLDPPQPRKRKMPAVAMARNLLAFNDKSLTAEQNAQNAYDCGMWLRAAMFRDRKAIEHCRDRGMQFVYDETLMDAQTVDDNTRGGFLVPTILARTILDVRDMVSVATKAARMYPMSGENENVPKRVSGLTVYKPAEGSAITTSEKIFAQVSLSATDAFTLTQISNKLIRGAVLSAADQVANEIGYAFADQSDNEFINGDGMAGSPYWGITGVITAIGAAGEVTAAGNLWTEITAANIASLVARLPERFHPRAVFISSRSFYHSVIEPLLENRGASKAELASTSPTAYKGYPFLFTDKMPTSQANSQHCLLFGSFFDSVLFGQREEVGIMSSEHRYFELDMLAIRGRTSYDIKVHEAGGAMAVGGYVALVTAAA